MRVPDLSKLNCCKIRWTIMRQLTLLQSRDLNLKAESSRSELAKLSHLRRRVSLDYYAAIHPTPWSADLKLKAESSDLSTFNCNIWAVLLFGLRCGNSPYSNFEI